MNPKELQKIFQTVQKNIRCPHCGERYDFENIHLMSFSGSVYLLQMECSNHAPLLASVAMNGARIEQITSASAISVNEVISAYQTISKAKTLKDIIG
ncbi:MAG: hypothetical protein NTY30_04725 [Candidatus Berkelbacteria bacterium]|nr:hypothetical protein [Candidatus Berkelbacteria bacterium]